MSCVYLLFVYSFHLQIANIDFFQSQLWQKVGQGNIKRIWHRLRWLIYSRYIHTKIRDKKLTFSSQLFIGAMITYGCTITAVKIPILLLYRRIFNIRGFKQISSIVGILCIAWLFADVICLVFFCSPIFDAWDTDKVFSKHYRDMQAIIYDITISNMLLDVIILCMPLFSYGNLLFP